MKLRLALYSALLASICATLPAANAPAAAAGYWEGAISLPNQQQLGIAVELASANGSDWQGTIDIPMQGMRGFKLSAVKVDADAVEFAMSGIPGDPHFTGKLAADANTLAGNFQQGGNELPFRLERKPRPAPVAREALPAHGVPGQGLAGRWLGAIAPGPNMELRLALELAADAAGKVSGVLVSLDQGKARIPLGDLSEAAGQVDFKVPRVNGSFTGKLSADGSEIAGEWSQNGQGTPLVFKRLPAEKTESGR